MEQGVSIYIHKGKAKEQLLDNGFPATSLGALKGRDKKAGHDLSSSAHAEEETHLRHIICQAWPLVAWWGSHELQV